MLTRIWRYWKQYTSSGNVKFCGCFGKQPCRSLKSKTEFTSDPTIPLLHIYLREIKTRPCKMCTQTSTAELSTVAKKGKSPVPIN